MNKIEALEKTIYNLENNVYEYDWETSNTCNCGVLARTLLDGKLATDCGLLESPTYGRGGPFSAHAACITTNLELPLVFRVLKDAGFTHEELVSLEYLADATICGRLGMVVRFDSNCSFSPAFDNKEDLIKYLKVWVEILEAEQPPIKSQQVPEQKEKIRYVSVPETISKEVALN